MSGSEADPRSPRGLRSSRAWHALPRFARFLAVGALNTAFGYATFAVLLLLGLHYALAALLSTVLGVAFNFQTIGRLVFGSRDASLLLRFLAVYGLTYVLNVAVLRMLEAPRVDLLALQALLMLPLAGVSFVLHRRFVFVRETAST